MESGPCAVSAPVDVVCLGSWVGSCLLQFATVRTSMIAIEMRPRVLRMGCLLLLS